MAAAQGHHDEALKWSREALAEYEDVGYKVGAYSARLGIAGSLIATDRQLDETQAMLVDTLRYYRGQTSETALAETEGLLARLAAKSGEPSAPLAHTNPRILVSHASAVLSRDRRRAYPTVQFAPHPHTPK